MTNEHRDDAVLEDDPQLVGRRADSCPSRASITQELAEDQEHDDRREQAQLERPELRAATASSGRRATRSSRAGGRRSARGSRSSPSSILGKMKARTRKAPTPTASMIAAARSRRCSRSRVSVAMSGPLPCTIRCRGAKLSNLGTLSGRVSTVGSSAISSLVGHGGLDRRLERSARSTIPACRIGSSSNSSPGAKEAEGPPRGNALGLGSSRSILRERSGPGPPPGSFQSSSKRSATAISPTTLPARITGTRSFRP